MYQQPSQIKEYAKIPQSSTPQDAELYGLDPDAMAAYTNSTNTNTYANTQSTPISHSYNIDTILAQKDLATKAFLRNVQNIKNVEMKNKNYYQGQMKGDKPHGKGVLHFTDGTWYEGSFVEGNLTGIGKRCYSDGRIYQGEFKNGMGDGQGYLQWKDGTSYNGKFKNGLRNGEGTLISSNGAIYIGEFKAGVKHGKCSKQTYNTGYFYEGEMKNGIRWGQGILTNEDTGFRAEGEFKETGLHGQGQMTFRNGLECIGQFKYNLLHGQGEINHSFGLKYKGDFSGFLPNGHGVHEFMGEKYDGSFCSGNKQGEAVRTHGNGDIYTGNFVSNFMSGDGVYTFSQGGYYEGEFLKDYFYGQGKLTTKEGNTYEGFWIKNKPMNPELIEKIKKDKVNLLDYLPQPTPITFAAFSQVPPAKGEKLNPEFSQIKSSDFWEAFVECVMIYQKSQLNIQKEKIKGFSSRLKSYCSYLIQTKLGDEFDEDTVNTTFELINSEKNWDSFVLLEPIARVFELEIFVLKVSGEGEIYTEIINEGNGTKRFYLVVDTRYDEGIKFEGIKNDKSQALGFCFSPEDKNIEMKTFQLVQKYSMI